MPYYHNVKCFTTLRLAEAQCTLGALHQHGRAGFHVDETRASELYSFAARQGLVSSNAMYINSRKFSDVM